MVIYLLSFRVVILAGDPVVGSGPCLALQAKSITVRRRKQDQSGPPYSLLARPPLNGVISGGDPRCKQRRAARTSPAHLMRAQADRQGRAAQAHNPLPS